MGVSIVRVGTHTGDRRLRPRLHQHFLGVNKDRIIFRKHIGRSLLARDRDPYLPVWNLDMTSSAAREAHGHEVDVRGQAEIESKVTDYICSNLTFITIPVSPRPTVCNWSRYQKEDPARPSGSTVRNRMRLAGTPNWSSILTLALRRWSNDQNLVCHERRRRDV